MSAQVTHVLQMQPVPTLLEVILALATRGLPGTGPYVKVLLYSINLLLLYIQEISKQWRQFFCHYDYKNVLQIFHFGVNKPEQPQNRSNFFAIFKEQRKKFKQLGTLSKQ